MNVTLATDPGDGTTVTFQVDGLSISESEVTASGVAAFTIAANAGGNNSLWDATLQVGSNTAVEATAQAVETNEAQTIGVTLSDTAVTYCSPLAGGGGTGTVTSVATGTGLTGGTITTSGTIVHQVQPVSGTGPAFVKSVEIDTLGHVSSVVGESTASAYRTATGTDDADNLTAGTVALARLPAIAAAYTGQIETAADKTYTIDPSVVADRTITSFYARSGAGTCTATLKNDTVTVGVVSVTTSSTTAVISNTSVSADDPITLVISSNSSATDVVFSVEFTQ